MLSAHYLGMKNKELLIITIIVEAIACVVAGVTCGIAVRAARNGAPLPVTLIVIAAIIVSLAGACSLIYGQATKQ